MAEAPVIDVVAAVIERGERYLVGRRPEEKRHGGLWEFPGGKVGPDESRFEAASRELDEELALRTSGVGPTLYSHRDPGSRFVIHFLSVTVEGDPVPAEHTALAWCGWDDLQALALAPADAAFVRWMISRRDCRPGA